MKERVVTTVRIRHHRIEAMPHLMRLPVNGKVQMGSNRESIAAPRGLFIALALSGMVWMAVIASASF